MKEFKHIGTAYVTTALDLSDVQLAVEHLLETTSMPSLNYIIGQILH